MYKKFTRLSCARQFIEDNTVEIPIHMSVKRLVPKVCTYYSPFYVFIPRVMSMFRRVSLYTVDIPISMI